MPPLLALAMLLPARYDPSLAAVCEAFWTAALAPGLAAVSMPVAYLLALRTLFG